MLSSVRRLVSSELPPHRRMSRAPEGEKLVLTDAQRIEPPRRAERPRSMRLEDRIAELEAAVSRTPDDWEPDGSEDQSQHQPDRIVYTPPEPRRTTRRVSRITLLETARRTDEPDDTSARDLSPEELEALARETTKEAVSEVLSEHSAFDAALREAVSDSLKDARAEAAAPPAPERKAEPEPAPEPKAAAPLPLPPETRAAEPPADSAPAAAPAPSAAIDKEALRPLVNKLLREELQGEIGERITRNVRKLVRQEIQRALAMQDLD